MGGLGCEIFKLPLIPTQTIEVPFLTKNVAVQCCEDRTHQKGPRVLPIPKVQGRQVRVIENLHPCAPERAGLVSALTRATFLSTAATAAAASASSAACPSTCANISERPWENWSNTATTLHFEEDGIQGEGDCRPRCLQGLQ